MFGGARCALYAPMAEADRPWGTPGYTLGLMRGTIEGGLTLAGLPVESTTHSGRS